jgi:hypothetical protein
MSIFNKPQQKPMPTFSTSQTVLPSAAISRIESGSLAELNVPNLMLKKGEKCCFVDKSYEMVETTTTRNIRKSGGTSMPSVFFKGVRYHMGSSESVPVTETKVDYIPGYLYITNKRIIFTSQKGGLEKSILSAFHPYSNAIGFQFGQKVINFILPRADLAVQTLQIMT